MGISKTAKSEATLERKWRNNGDEYSNHSTTRDILYNSPMSAEAKLITIVEDDPDQRRNYCDAMANKGYRVSAYGTYAEALAGFREVLPDLAVLDIVLGKEVDAGFQLCRELLTLEPGLPILFLTERIDEIDKISGLRMGAWDYQAKPISLDYFAERVASLLRLSELRNRAERRVESSAAPDDSGATTTPGKVVGQLTIDKEAMRMYWAQQPINLTMTEFRMLERLTRDPGHAISYASLMHATMQNYVTNNTINTHLRNIRNKLQAIDPRFDCIRNEYGFGYRWVTQ